MFRRSHGKQTQAEGRIHTITTEVGPGPVGSHTAKQVPTQIRQVEPTRHDTDTKTETDTDTDRDGVPYSFTRTLTH